MTSYPLILAYHRVNPFGGDSITNTPRQLEQHIWLLRLMGYRFSTLVDWWRRRDEPSASEAIITFDDGWRDNFEYALPVLNRTGVSATIFLIANYVGKDRMPPGMADGDGRAFLTIEQIRAMQTTGIDFESHTSNHEVLIDLDDKELEAALLNSRLALEALLESPVTAICYPKSRCDARVARAARASGYQLGVLTNAPHSCDGSGIDELRIPRIGIYAKDGIARFLAKLLFFHVRRFAARFSAAR